MNNTLLDFCFWINGFYGLRKSIQSIHTCNQDIFNTSVFEPIYDGKPELCSTLSIGWGIVDNRIIIYDYAGGASYELSDRGHFDYVLNMQGDSLVVEKRAYMQDEIIESGELVFLDGTIQIKTE